MRPRGSFLVVLLAAGLASAGPSSRKPRRVPIGEWGGPRAGLTVEKTSARLELDCAHGTIGRPLAVDRKGAFQVEGRYFPEHGGPVRADEENAGRAARYSGSLAHRTLTLTLRLEDGQTLGPYTLTLGQPPRLMKCK